MDITKLLPSEMVSTALLAEYLEMCDELQIVWKYGNYYIVQYSGRS